MEIDMEKEKDKEVHLHLLLHLHLHLHLHLPLAYLSPPTIAATRRSPTWMAAPPSSSTKSSTAQTSAADPSAYRKCRFRFFPADRVPSATFSGMLSAARLAWSFSLLSPAGNSAFRTQRLMLTASW